VSGALESLRGQVDDVDAELVALLGRRFGLTREIGVVKAAAGLPGLDAGREAEQSARLAQQARAAGVAPELVQLVFDDVRAQVRHEHALARPRTIAEMRDAELQAERQGVSLAELMRRAGVALAEAGLRMLAGAPGPVIVACGNGNNGGDGYVCATELRRRGVEVLVCAVGRDPLAPGTLAGDAAAAFEAAGGRVIVATEDLTPGDMAPALIVDALLGTGLSRPVTGLMAHVIGVINECGAPVLAADVPSGVAGDTGEIMGVAVRAARTVMMGLTKPASVLQPGCQCFGVTEVADILPRAGTDSVTE